MIKSFSAKIIEIIEQTPTVKTFRFEKPSDFEYFAGQSVMIAYPDRSVPGKRQYSLSNVGEDFFDLTIKVHGEFTKKMFTLEPGYEFEIKGPFGRDFIFNIESAQDTVFLAGGVGVTPFMSALQYASQKKMDLELLLLFCNKTQEEIIAKDWIDSQLGQNRKAVYTLTREKWEGQCGRIDQQMIEANTKNDAKEYLYFICGPASFISAMQSLLDSMNIPKDQVIVEDWGI